MLSVSSLFHMIVPMLSISAVVRFKRLDSLNRRTSRPIPEANRPCTNCQQNASVFVTETPAGRPFKGPRMILGGRLPLAFSSILPMVADLETYAMGGDLLFDTRVSGGAAQGALSNPSIGLANSAFDAARGIKGTLFHGEQFSQKDARALQGLLPFSNFLPVVWATNAMVGELPNRNTHKHMN